MGILRILLALSVIILHSKPMFGSMLVGEVAVNTFFIISGFYMALILNGKYGSHFGTFYSNRILRLYPTYFAILVFVIASDGARWAIRGVPSRSLAIWAHHFHAMDLSTFSCLLVSNLTFFGADALTFYAFSPATGSLFYHGLHVQGSALGFQIITQTWSLGTEVLFYLLAPLATRLNVGALIGICLTCLLLKVADVGWVSSPQTWWETFFLWRLPLFLYGAVAYRWMKFVQLKSWTNIWFGPLSVILLVSISIAYGPFHVAPAIYYGAVVALAPFLFQFSNAFHWDRVLGDFSYSMYLLHWIVIQYVWQIINKVPEWSFSFICFIVSLAGSMLVWHFIEKPIDRFRQDRLRKTLAAPVHRSEVETNGLKIE